MPRAKIAQEEYYHIYNRGINKENTFLHKNDFIRALFLLLFFKSYFPIPNIGRQVEKFRRRLNLTDTEIELSDIEKNRLVEICAFSIMPNHFHFLLKEVQEGGISFYMQRFEIAYTKYFNILHERSGYLFQGPFQSVHVYDNEQLLYLTAYIHKNPKEWKQYPWSSYQDFISPSRWKNLLQNEIILSQFSSKSEYKNFVETSTAKEIDEDLLLE